VNYQIAIPSYKRENTIKNKTLKLLERYNIDPNVITIFVADSIELSLYKESLRNTPYENSIVQGVPTIGMQRNFIENYYPWGERLMMFDDDLTGVKKKNGKKLDEVEDLEEEIIFKGFSEAEKLGSKCFGIYAASNAYFMKDRIYNNLCYIIGSMFGVIVEKNDFLRRVTNHGEDYEYSIRQYIHNGVLCRLDNYTVISNYYKEAGGLQTVRTKEYVHKSIKKIEEMFPEYCKMYIRKSTGFAELRLRDNSGNKKQEALF
tara:strand:- start:787 stop:1566 length:780 start_codon:yes stop_codon:yes gene_type:complete